MDERVQQTRLPPSTQAGIQRGYLKITPLALSFFKSQQPNTLLKITFWGSSCPNYLRLDTTETFPIYCPLSKFKLYLIDSKVAQLEVVDSRNYKPICSAYLNWLLYLRPMHDHQLYHQAETEEEQEPSPHLAYYLPFIDQEMEDTLPLYRHAGVNKLKSNEKLGEIKIRWQCRIFDLQEPKCPTPPQFATEANLYNIRVGMAVGAKESQFVSIREIDMVHEESRSNNLSVYERPYAPNSKMSESNHSVYLGLDPKKTQGCPSNNEARHSNISKISKISKGLREIEKARGELNRRRDSNLQVELLRIRMQMAEYIPEKKTLTNQKVVKIFHFELANRQLNIKDLLFFDLVSETKDSLKKKYRIFPENMLQTKAVFNSTLGVDPQCSLSFIIALKKPKEFIAKAQISVKDIGQGKVVNLFGNDGLLCGFLRVGAVSDAKAHQNQTVKESSDKKRTQAEQMRIRQLQTLLEQRKPVQRGERRQMAKGQLSKQKEQNTQLYFLVLLQESPEREPHSFVAFNRKIEGPADHKFGIWPQRQLVGRPLSISVLNSNELLLFQETIMEKIASVPTNPVNLTCSLIIKKQLPHTKITCSLYAGSSDQLVFFMQELTENILNQATALKHAPKKEYTQEKSERLESQERQDTEEAHRKLKTEENLRLQLKQRMMTEDHERQSNTVHELDVGGVRLQPEVAEEIQQENNQNFYLVYLLTRFLQELEPKTLPDLKEIEKQHFLRGLPADSQLQVEMVDMIVSIFQDEPGSPLNLDLLRQSLKAFTTFSDLYQQQKKKLLSEVCGFEPKALGKIKKYAEMGMINEKILWQQAWKKITSIALKQNINKIYRISSYGPTEAILLIEDIEAIKTESKPKLRSVDICNLGVLIKEWVENFLAQISRDTMKRIREKTLSLCEDDSMLNIRTTNEIFQSEVSLRLSLWESLLLIEQVKSAYICDIDIGEGLITGDSFLAWLDSVVHRNQPGNDNDSVNTSKLSVEGLNQIEAWGNTTNKNARKEIVGLKESTHKGWDNIADQIETPDNRSAKSKLQSRYGQESQLQYKNNDSEIVDIANLLRQREEEEEKKLVQRSTAMGHDRILEGGFQLQKRKENIAKIQSKSKFIDEQIIQTRQKVENNDSAVPKRPSFRLFYLQVQQLKIYKQQIQQPLLKLMVTLGQDDSELNTSSFIYLTSHNQYSEANLKSFEIKTSLYKNQSIQVKLRSERQMIGTAFLDWEQYIPWYKESVETYSKTLVIYGAKGTIIGKIRFLLNKTDPNQHKQIQVQNSQSIRLKITQGTVFGSNTFYLTIANDSNSAQPMQIQVGQQYVLSLDKPIYARELLLQNQARDSSCLIILEQLYLKQFLTAQYPLIDNTNGVFRGNVFIAMAVGALPLAQGPHPNKLSLQPNQRSPMAQQQITKLASNKKKIADPIDAIKELKSHQIMKQIDSIYDSLKNKFGKINRQGTQ